MMDGRLEKPPPPNNILCNPSQLTIELLRFYAPCLLHRLLFFFQNFNLGAKPTLASTISVPMSTFSEAVSPRLGRKLKESRSFFDLLDTLLGLECRIFDAFDLLFRIGFGNKLSPLSAGGRGVGRKFANNVQIFCT